MVSVSAPGKVHLMGEHAVVYGRPALLSAINLRLCVSIQESKETTILPANAPKDVQEHMAHIISLVQQHYRLSDLPSMKIALDSEIPFGYHLGSSAALAVATIGAVSFFVTKKWNPAVINQLAYEAEKRVHGNPSGGDNSVITHGGFVWYRKELEFLKSIWQLPMKLSDTLNHFYLINTGKPAETTGEMVTAVQVKMKSEKFNMETIFSENELQTKRVAQALKTSDKTSLIDAMHKGQKTLEAMGVVSDQAVSIIREIEQSGGAAKILGGGGHVGPVGFLLAYHTDETALTRIADTYRFSKEHIQLGEDGVRIEQKE